MDSLQLVQGQVLQLLLKQHSRVVDPRLRRFASPFIDKVEVLGRLLVDVLELFLDFIIVGIYLAAFEDELFGVAAEATLPHQLVLEHELLVLVRDAKITLHFLVNVCMNITV